MRIPGSATRLLLLLAGMLSLAAPARADLDAVRKAGVMVIATTGTRVPWTYVDESNRLTGYDIAWGELICADLGVKPEWVKLDFRGIMPGLLASRFDAVLSGVSVTDQRKETFAFSAPYAYDDTVAMVRADNNAVQQIADLKGLVVAAGTGSEQEEVAKRIVGVQELRSLPGFSDLVLNLRSSRVDAVVTSHLAASYFLKTNPNSGTRIAGDGVSPAFQAMVLRKDEPALQAAVDAIIERRKADGTYQRLYQQYFGIAPVR